LRCRRRHLLRPRREDTAMTARAKFLFNNDFGPVKEAPPTVAPEVHEAEIAAIELRGYQRGLTAAEAQARTEAERRTATAFERIASVLTGIAGEMKAIEGRLEAEAVEVAVAVARKLAPALVAREPLAEIAALATECFNSFLAAPHVVVRVNSEFHELACERLDEIARGRGFEGRLVVLGETEIAPGDCRIEWADGGVIRDRTTVASAIDDLVGRYVAARRAT
jgi:flagellar assembly protein FliH